MPPKKHAEPAPPPPEPAQELDPVAIAAREAQERKNAEDRKAFERVELEARRRVEALEGVSAKCVLWDKERRLNPAAWERRAAPNAGTEQVYVKLLTGNRALPQQNYVLPLTADLTLGGLKKLIQQRAGENGATRALRGWFVPENQTILLNGKELGAVEEETATEVMGITPRSPPVTPPAPVNQAGPAHPPQPPVDANTLTLAALNVRSGTQLHLMLRTPRPSADMVPSKIK
jgi:hypothetical protein